MGQFARGLHEAFLALQTALGRGFLQCTDFRLAKILPARLPLLAQSTSNLWPSKLSCNDHHGIVPV